MAVIPVSGEGSVLTNFGAKRTKGQPKSGDAPRDTVELSGEAAALRASERNERIKAIRERIDEGFYFSPDVTNAVADKIVDDLLQGGRH